MFRFAIVRLAPAVLVAWTAVRMLGLDVGFPLQLLMPFTPYVALVGAFFTIATLALRAWLATATTAACVVLLLGAIVPRTRAHEQPFPVGQGSPQTMMVLNMRDGRADPQAITYLVQTERVDVLALVELKSSLTGLRAAGLQKELPGLIYSQWSRGGGSALFSRSELTAYALPRLGPYPETPAGRLAIDAGRQLDISVQHPPHATRPGFAKEWVRRLRSLPQAGSGARLPIVLGDFNATVDQRQFRELRKRGLRDAALQVGQGLQMTFPERPFPLLAIDHVLVDRRIAVVDVQTKKVPGSDHRALIARLRIPPAR